MAIWARIGVTDNTIRELIGYDPTGAFAEDPDFRFEEVPAIYEKWIAAGWLLPEGEDPRPASIEGLLAQMSASVADVRWQKQTLGIVVNGAKFLSDPTNLGIISNAILGAQVIENLNGPGTFPPVNWKSESGFVSLDLSALIGVGMFGMQYTQLCFNREGEIITDLTAISTGSGDIDEKTIDLINAYEEDIDADWPSNTTP